MCGIFGILPERTLKPQQLSRARKLFTYLAVANSSRGKDAAGGAVIQEGGNGSMFKLNIPSTALIGQRNWFNLMQRATPRTAMWMGHTRYATCGANTADNAHPFVFEHAEHGRMYGAHNGMLWNHEKINGEDTNVHEVDSACLIWHLSQYPDSKWPELLAGVAGSFALSLYRNGKAYLVRNYGSPLYITYVPILNSWVYASEGGAIKHCVAACGMRTGEIKEIPDDTLYSIPDLRIKDCETRQVPASSVFPEAWGGCYGG